MQRIAGVVQNYAWGDANYIAELLGVEKTEPQAEYWLGAHPRGVGILADGSGLDQAIASDEIGILGASVAKKYGQFPFLLKILAAAKPLSIQCHPTKRQAEVGFDMESLNGPAIDSAQRNYRDNNHKPELICALTRFEAKVGFRQVPEILELFDLLKTSESQPLLALLRESKPAGDLISNVLRYLLELSKGDAAALVQGVVTQAERHLKEIDEEMLGLQNRLALEWTAKIERHFPGDIGVVVALLLNHVSLEPGQAVGFEAGNLHCYLSGVGVEIMANSDNVIRGGLTGKHIDVAELLAVVESSPSLPTIDSPACEIYSYGCPADDFRLSRITSAQTEPFESQGPEIWLVTSGEFEISAGSTVLRLLKGDACFVPASNPAWLLSGVGECWRAGVGA